MSLWCDVCWLFFNHCALAQECTMTYYQVCHGELFNSPNWSKTFFLKKLLTSVCARWGRLYIVKTGYNFIFFLSFFSFSALGVPRDFFNNNKDPWIKKDWWTLTWNPLSFASLYIYEMLAPSTGTRLQCIIITRNQEREWEKPTGEKKAHFDVRGGAVDFNNMFCFKF